MYTKHNTSWLQSKVWFLNFLQRNGAVHGSFSRACEYGKGGWWAHCTAHCSKQWSLGHSPTTCFYGTLNVVYCTYYCAVWSPKYNNWREVPKRLDYFINIAPQTTCNLNAKNYLKQMTPLRLAVSREHSRMVEVLVGYGADVNTACSDGHTPLHVVTTNKDMKKPTPKTQQLQRVRINVSMHGYQEQCLYTCRHAIWDSWKGDQEKTYSCCKNCKKLYVLPVC